MKEFCGNENGKIYDCITSEHNCFRSFVKTESEVYFSLEDQVVPLALNTGPSFKSFGVFFSKKGLIVDYYFWEVTLKESKNNHFQTWTTRLDVT